MRIGPAVVACALFGCGSTAGTDGGSSVPGAGHFTYAVGDKVFRIEAKEGATAVDVSAQLPGTATRDRWLVPSHDGVFQALSTDRITCSMGECLAAGRVDSPATLALVKAGDTEVVLEGTPAISNDGTRIVYPSQGGPHAIDLFLTTKSGSTWSAPVLLTGASTRAYNNMPSLTFDETRALFDCGQEPYPESGNNDACEVKLDGSGFRVVVSPSTLPNARQNWVQFPHDSLDGVLFESSWPIDGDSPETVWQLPATGAPKPIGKAFGNAVSPCALRDGRFGVLWLTRPGNSAGVHELTLVARDGTLLATLTPGIDVNDIGIGCSD